MTQLHFCLIAVACILLAAIFYVVMMARGFAD
jgi:hypothetical protein